MLSGGDTLTVTAPKVTLAFFIGISTIVESAGFFSTEAVELETFDECPPGIRVTFEGELLVTDVEDKTFESDPPFSVDDSDSVGMTTQWR